MDPHEGSPCRVVITPGGAPEYQIFLLGPEVQVSTDGTDEQAFEVAAWVREQLPEEWAASEVWIVDEAFTGHTLLGTGMSPADVRMAWGRARRRKGHRGPGRRRSGACAA